MISPSLIFFMVMMIVVVPLTVSYLLTPPIAVDRATKIIKHRALSILVRVMWR